VICGVVDFVESADSGAAIWQAAFDNDDSSLFIPGEASRRNQARDPGADDAY
jgi:hypothetical protein